MWSRHRHWSVCCAVEGSRWRELLSERLVTPVEIVRGYQALHSAGTVSPEVILEELVVDPRYPDDPPVDYKVMTFDGVVGLVEAKRRRRVGGVWRNCWKVFEADWTSLRNPFNDYGTDESIEPPVQAEALLDMARRISEAAPRASCGSISTRMRRARSSAR